MPDLFKPNIQPDKRIFLSLFSNRHPSMNGGILRKKEILPLLSLYRNVEEWTLIFHAIIIVSIFQQSEIKCTIKVIDFQVRIFLLINYRGAFQDFRRIPPDKT